MGTRAGAGSVITTFLFADIAGFTALTEAHGDDQAADLVVAFSEAVQRELPSCGGTHVKTIGDALMLAIPEPADAIRFALWITHELMRRHGAPGIRVGLHHGPAVERHRDYFGSSVNLAARVSALAVGGEVLVTGNTAALAPVVDGVVYESRGRHELRNVSEPVEIFAALRLGQAGDAALVIDPVCRMAVDPRQAPGRLIYRDDAYHFCSLTCAGIFAQHPERYGAGGAASERSIRKEAADHQKPVDRPADSRTEQEP